MRMFLLLCVLLTLPWTTLAADVSLSWDPSPSPNIAGYKVYYGYASGNYGGTDAYEGPSPIDVGNILDFPLSGLDEGLPHFFAVTAYNFNGIESGFSNEVFITELVMPPTLRPVQGFTFPEVSFKPLIEERVTNVTRALYRREDNKMVVYATSSEPTDELSLYGFGPMVWNASKNRWQLVKTIPIEEMPTYVVVVGKFDSSVRHIKLR